MADQIPEKVNGEELAEELKLRPPTLGVDLPEPLAKALKLKPKQLRDRSDWQQWIGDVSTVETVLLWVGPRRDDDQAFLAALGKSLGAKTTLWSFHGMAMLTVDRLTGDAVLKLLETAGLKDGRCANTGFGYYARSFVRAPEIDD